MSDGPVEPTGTSETTETITDATTAEVSGEAAHNQTPVDETTVTGGTDAPAPAVDETPQVTGGDTPAPAESEAAQVEESYAGNIDLSGAGNDPAPEAPDNAVQVDASEPSILEPEPAVGQPESQVIDPDSGAPVASPEEIEASQEKARETAKADDEWRTENPGQAYVREPVEGVGGESFSYGDKQ